MKLRNVFSLIGNIIIFLIVSLLVVGLFVNGKPFEPMDLLLNYHLFALNITGLVSFVGIILNIVALSRKKDIKSNIYYSLRITAFNVLIISALLIPIQYSPKWFELNLNTFTLLVTLVYMIISVFALDSYFKTKWWTLLISSILPVLYFATTYILYTVNALTTLPYSFMYLVIESKVVFVNCAALLLFILLPIMTGICLWLYTKRNKEVAIAQVVKEPTKQPKKVTATKKTTKVPTKKEPAKKTTNKTPSSKKEVKTTPPHSVDIEIPENIDYDYRIYHVTKRTDVDYYQVKYGKDVRCIKLFKTMDEASKYARDLASVTGASVRVHGEDGRISKTK